MGFQAGEKVSWRTINNFMTGVLIRPIVDGMKVWIVETEKGTLVPVHEDSMIKEEAAR